MQNHPFDVDAYDAVLRSEANKLWGIGIVLLIVLIAMTVYSIVLIREDATKKLPYVQLIAVVAVSAFLIASFGASVISYSKDITGKTYIQYEGPASIGKRRKVIFGNIPTWYYEYFVSFDNDGEPVELSTRKDYGKQGDIEKLYIVYARNSGEILEFSEGDMH